MNMFSLNYSIRHIQLGERFSQWHFTLLVVLCMTLASGCSKPRGTLEYAIEPVPNIPTQTLFVATSRSPLADTPYYSSARSNTTHYSRLEVSIPTDRKVGEAPVPGKKEPDPNKHFLLASHDKLGNESDFVRSLNKYVVSSQTKRRQGALLVHGYNMNFAEAAVDVAQFTYDLKSPAVMMLYSWPSAAKVTKYLDDRESALFARDSFGETLAAVSRSSLDGYIVAGHSMGTFLVMETLRSLALQNDRATLSKIDAVVLASADLDIGLFQRQAETVLRFGLPIFVIVSDDDKALSVSARLRGGGTRVGAVRTSEELGGIDVSIIDLSDLEDGGSFAHSKAADSEIFLSYVRGLNEQGVNVLGSQAEPGLFTRGVLLAQSGTDLLITQ